MKYNPLGEGEKGGVLESATFLEAYDFSRERGLLIAGLKELMDFLSSNQRSPDEYFGAGTIVVHNKDLKPLRKRVLYRSKPSSKPLVFEVPKHLIGKEGRIYADNTAYLVEETENGILVSVLEDRPDNSVRFLTPIPSNLVDRAGSYVGPAFTGGTYFKNRYFSITLSPHDRHSYLLLSKDACLETIADFSGNDETASSSEEAKTDAFLLIQVPDAKSYADALHNARLGLKNIWGIIGLSDTAVRKKNLLERVMCCIGNPDDGTVKIDISPEEYPALLEEASSAVEYVKKCRKKSHRYASLFEPLLEILKSSQPQQPSQT